MLQIQNLEKHLCQPTGHNKPTTGTPMQYDCMNLSKGFYTMSLKDTGEFAAKSNGEGEEETSVTSD